jgi:hypothetical protein
VKYDATKESAPATRNERDSFVSHKWALAEQDSIYKHFVPNGTVSGLQRISHSINLNTYFSLNGIPNLLNNDRYSILNEPRA